MAFTQGVAQTVHLKALDGEDPVPTSNPAVTVSLDGGATFEATDNAAVTTAYGVSLELSAAETARDMVLVRVTADNADAQVVAYYFEDAYTPQRAENLDAAVSSRAEPGDEMDLVDAPNATAIAAIQSGIGAITVTSGGTNIVDGDLKIEVPRGDSYSLVVEAEDDDGDAIDLSGYDDYTFTVKPTSARSDADDTNAAFQVAGTLSGAGNNVLTFAIEPADTELCDLDVWYDCDIEAANTARTLVRTVAVGRYRTTLDVTRGASS